jgi:hypothetical protein
MLQIPSIRLPYPKTGYSAPATGKIADEYSGIWDLRIAKFVKGMASPAALKWKMITGPGVNPTGESVGALTRHFHDQVVRTHVCRTSQRLGEPLTLANDQETTLYTVFKKYLPDKQNPVPDIVILLIKINSQDLYSSFKLRLCRTLHLGHRR